MTVQTLAPAVASPRSPVQPVPAPVVGRSALEYLLILLLLCGLAVLLQVQRGTFASSFGTSSDESGHFVTGLMVRDYLATGASHHPVRFAEEYYLHYPRVAIGQWPPVFYLLQAAWMLPFGGGRFSILLLMATMSALVALVLYGVLTRVAGVKSLAALLYAGLWLAFPLVQEYSGAVMAEIPLALFCLCAVVAYGVYLNTGQMRFNLLFAAFSVLAVLTKGNGLALAFVPATCIVLGRRWELLRCRMFYMPAALVIALCAPWYLLTIDSVQSTWIGSRGALLSYAAAAVGTYLKVIVALGGGAVAIVAALGAAVEVRNRSGQGLWHAALGLLVGAVLFHAVVPSSLEPRHMVMAAPLVVLFLAAGVRFLVSRAARIPVTVPRHAEAVLASVFILGCVSGTTAKQWQGFQHVAGALVADSTLARSAILVASDPIGDGILISETAIQDARPGRILLRADKVLSRSNWVGDQYQSLYEDPAAVRDYLRRIPVEVVVLDLSVPRPLWRQHHQLLVDAISTHPAWQLLSRDDVVRDGEHHPGALRLYRQMGIASRTPALTFADAIGATAGTHAP